MLIDELRTDGLIVLIHIGACLHKFANLGFSDTMADVLCESSRDPASKAAKVS